MQDKILLPSNPQVLDEKGNEATVQVEGLHPGYGITIGNALKRVLHSSLPGAAVTSVRIEGVDHEFSTIDGVLEDVLSILLNLKQVRFRCFSGENFAVSINAKGEGVVSAKDIICPSNIEIVNPDLHIVTLTSPRSKFNAELTIEKGVGYVTRESIKREKVSVGEITLDAIFTPVRKVRYEVENMRVGSATNYNRLRLSIETDGTMTSKEAFSKAVEILKEQIAQLEIFKEETDNGVEDEVKAQEILEEIGKEQTDESNTMNIKMEDLKLSSRTINSLNKAQIYTIVDIVKFSAKRLLEFEGVGEKALLEIQRALGNLGIVLPHDE